MEIPVQLLRNGLLINLILIPKKWKGRGLLGYLYLNFDVIWLNILVEKNRYYYNINKYKFDYFISLYLDNVN